MYKKLRNIVAITVLGMGVANAQVTVQSPYSRYGLGNIRGSLLPQFRAMGGIATGVQRTGFYNINMQNPATYANIELTSLDIGLNATYLKLDNGTTTANNFNASLDHVAMAFPVTRKSALSIGVLPYSDLGYDFSSRTTVGTGTSAKNVDYIYKGEGGLSKAYIGYGMQFGDHFRIGANAEYLFGNMIQSRASEYPGDQGASFNAKIQDKNTVGGLAFSYGVQYDFRIARKTSLVLGYSGTSSSKLSSSTSRFVTQYTNDASGNEQTAIDTLVSVENAKTDLKLPLTHTFGFTIQRDSKWLVGADYRMGKWSDLTIGSVNQNLQDTYGVSVGGQFTPDISAINGYFKRVDYRLGFSYDKTYIQINNQDIKNTAVTFGLGLPLSSYTRNAFYKANFTVEYGKRGNVVNGLLAERYVNFALGFTLNDKWFTRFKFD